MLELKQQTYQMNTFCLKERPADGHKGTFGHALIVAGKYGMAGASILAAKACLRSGVGKVTVHIPRKNNDILQIAVPEAIVQHDDNEYCFTHEASLEGIQALALGPGIGTAEVTAQALHQQLLLAKEIPTVVDADALNLLSQHVAWLDNLPDACILTPHGGELKRLFTAVELPMNEQGCRRFVSRYGCHLVVKGHPTIIYHPDATSYVCPYGNDGMATAGSGDVLTGILVALLAQGYESGEAARLGVTLHALAGDEAALRWGHPSLVASDIIENLNRAFMKLNETKYLKDKKNET